MTNAQLLIRLEPHTDFGLKESEIHPTMGRTRIGPLLRKALKYHLITRYKAPDGSGRSIFRYLITEKGRTRLAWYRQNRPEYYGIAAAGIAEGMLCKPARPVNSVTS